MNEDSKIIETKHNKQISKLQSEKLEGESKMEDTSEKNKLESNAINTADLSKNKWAHILDEVRPIERVLLHKCPSMTIRYKLIIGGLKRVIRDLPLSQNLLPMHARLCKSTIRFLQKERKMTTWKEYAKSLELEQLENSLKLLLSQMTTIATELKIDLGISGCEENSVANHNEKQFDKNTNNISVDKEQETGKKNVLIPYRGKIVTWENKWAYILDEIQINFEKYLTIIDFNEHAFAENCNRNISKLLLQTVSPILLKKFPSLAGRHELFISEAKKVIRRLPLTKWKLPWFIRHCKRHFKRIQREKAKGLWDDFANISMDLEQLENTYMVIFTKMVSIAIELEMCLVVKRRSLISYDIKRR